ncbi:MAG: beta-galactosidase, partial [Oscillospiraceae bacterium]|nr:beta-galactosidase [Oscillospiraceae bacterium]
MKHTHQPHRILALLLALVMVISMAPVRAAAAGSTIVGSPETVVLGTDVAAQRVNDFNKGWKFNLGNTSASNPNFDDSAWETVDLPHDFSITQHFTASGEAESGFLPGGTGWYRKSFTLDEQYKDKTFLLNFDGVYMHAYVYVNGIPVGEHHYGYTNFAFDISDYLVCDGATQNVVAVKAVNELPSSRWYSGSGIYRDVTLYALESVHVDLNGVTITTPDIADGDGTAAIKVDVVNDSVTAAEVTVRTTIDGVVGEATVSVPARSSAEAELEVVVSDPALWSLADPNLYTALTEVLVNGQVVDSCEDTFGFRWIEWKSTGFYLNGEAVKLNGVCMHHDQGALGAAAYYDAIYRQMSIMKDMGANAIRVTHNPADESLIA